MSDVLDRLRPNLRAIGGTLAGKLAEDAPVRDEQRKRRAGEK